MFIFCLVSDTKFLFDQNSKQFPMGAIGGMGDRLAGGSRRLPLEVSQVECRVQLQKCGKGKTRGILGLATDGSKSPK